MINNDDAVTEFQIRREAMELAVRSGCSSFETLERAEEIYQFLIKPTPEKE